MFTSQAQVFRGENYILQLLWAETKNGSSLLCHGVREPPKYCVVCSKEVKNNDETIIFNVL